MVTLSNLLDADIGTCVAQLLGLRTLLVSFMPVCQSIKKSAIFQILTHRPPLSEKSLEKARDILQIGRYFVASSGQPFCNVINESDRRIVVQNSHFEHILERRGGGYELYCMNETMLSRWQKIEVDDYVQSHFDADYDPSYKRWGPTRVSGHFIVLFERPDGVIFVSDDFKRVYLVNLSRISIQKSLIHAKSNDGICYTNLLPWDGQIITDDLVLPHSVCDDKEWNRAMRAYLRAYDTNTIITNLPLANLQKARSGSHNNEDPIEWSTMFMQSPAAAPGHPFHEVTLQCFRDGEQHMLRILCKQGDFSMHSHS